MASPTDESSIEDIMEDLDLHQALIQSLIETRPGAVEERNELEAIVMDLERKLAQRQGLPFNPAPSQRPESPRGIMQFDGTEDTTSEGSGLKSDSDVFALPAQQHDSLRRKRSFLATDLSSPSSPPSTKKMRSQRPSTPSVLSSYTQFSDDDEALDQLLGVPGDGSINFRAEQLEAEKWLEDRRAQERADEEYARRLQESLDDETSYIPPKQSEFVFPQSHESYSLADKLTSPQISTPERLQSSSYSDGQPSFGAPSLGVPSTLYRHPSQAPSPFDFRAGQTPLPPPKSSSAVAPYHVIGSSDEDSNDDEDLAEIPANDFYRNRTMGGKSHGSHVHFPRYPGSDSIDELGYLSGAQSHAMYIPSKGYPIHAPGANQTTNPLPYGLSHLQYAFNGAKNMLTKGRSYPWIKNESENGVKYPVFPNDDNFVDNKQANEELKELLESLRPDIELSKDSREGTPQELNFALFEHQKLGLAWMKLMEEGNNKGGILADDMGLGKTVQALSLIVARPSTDPGRKTTLIIAPVALLQQWKREIDRLIKPEHKISCFILHGDKRKTSFDKLKKYDVVLTTFGTMGSELKRREEWDEMRRFASQSGANMLEEARNLCVLGPQSTWYRVIIDEAQCIKNRNTRSSIACCSLNTTYRWCMSGTPMMNGVHELHSLLKFLRIRPYNSLDNFNKTFTKPLKGGEKERNDALQRLRVVLRAVLLRRTKFSKLDGKPLIDLPPRNTEKVHAVFSEDEQELYDSLENRTQIQFNKYLNAGTIGRNYSNILVLLLRLRQACCHPHLIKDLSVDVSAVTENADFTANAKQFGPEVIRRLKENPPLECPVCIDAVENAVIFYPCGHATCAECFARITDPSVAVRQGVDGAAEAKCPNCRAKVDPKKVTDHLSFKKVHFPEEVPVDDEPQESSVPAAVTEDSETDSDENTDSDDDDEDENDDDLDDFVVPDEFESEDESTIKGKKALKEPKSRGKRKNKHKSRRKGKNKDEGDKRPKKTLAVLRKEGQKNAAARRKYFKRLEKNWITSAKIEKAVEILQNIKSGESGEKTIIFSQFTSLLDLLEVPINRRGWNYRRYDGSMRPRDRNESVIDFTDNPDCDIMLVSLKAGNAGLNLVAASQVIIFDPFWNPYIEEQAIDRAHRLGQTRPVQVHRILVEKTVEDRILSLQDEKREIIEGALDENAASQISRLGVRELKFLFNVH